MEIKIKPQTIQCQQNWDSKMEGVVFVAKEEDIEPVWKELCKQDDYWEYYEKLICVAPTEINYASEIESYCQYCGKTDIYNVPELKANLAAKGIEIILFQYRENNY